MLAPILQLLLVQGWSDFKLKPKHMVAEAERREKNRSGCGHKLGGGEGFTIRRHKVSGPIDFILCVLEFCLRPVRRGTITAQERYICHRQAIVGGMSGFARCAII